MPGLIAVAVLLISVALGAVAFAIALRPHGSEQASGLVVALLLGAGAFLALFLILRSLVGRFLSIDGVRLRYLALAAALGLLVAAAAVRSLTTGTGTDDRRARLAQERQDFDLWTAAAVPLIVRYRDAVRVDAPLLHGPHDEPAKAGLRGTVARAERMLLGLQRASHPLVASAPAELRSFMPLLRRALVLAIATQRTYAAGLSRRKANTRAGRAAGGRASTGFLRRGRRLLRTSEEAMAAFTQQVNAVGAQLSVGRLPAAPAH